MTSRKNCDAITAKRIRSALNNKGWSAQRLSEETGISKSSISQYVNGYSAPSNLNAGRIGEALGVSPAWLMGFGGYEEPIVNKTVDTILETRIGDEIVKIAVEKSGKNKHLGRISSYVYNYSRLSEKNKTIVDNLTKSLLESQDDPE